MKIKHLLLVSFVILIIGLTAVSAADSDNTATTDNSGSDVAVDSSSSTSQATDTSTHTDSSVDKTSDTSSFSSQKTDTTSQSTTQKVSEKTSENTQTTSDTTAKAGSDTSSQSTQSTSQSTQQVQSDSKTTNENANSVNENVLDNSKSISTADDDENETSAVTHIVTQDNYENYFIQSTDTSEGGLSDSVNDGDILDFQGTLNLTDKSLVINKAVNITSTTGDSLICLNTEAGTLLGDNQGQSFVVNNGGSYSNITNINFWGTQIWITNTSYVVFDNITSIVNGTRVGSGVGQTSIRPGCEYITIKNSYLYTADNGGSSSLVIAGGKYCTLDNNTVEAEGTSGNIIYLTTYNADLDGIDDFNSYNNITNNHVICNGDPVSIRWGIVLTGHDNNVINNTIDYPEGGTGITQQWNYDGTFNTTIINNTCVNCGQSNIPENSTVYGNTFSEVQISAGSTFYNNTVNSIMITGDECIITNNTILSDLTLNTTNNLIENNTFDVENTSINLTAGNNSFKNNQITGNTSFILNGNGTVLDNNVIEGNVYISINGLNNTFTNQQINGNVSYYIIGSDNIIENITGTIENLQITLFGSNYNLGNLEISGIASYNITGDNNIIQDVTGGSTIQVNITGDNNSIINNTVELNELSNSSIIINGSNNVFENRISGNGEILVNITGSNNTFKGIETSGSTVFNINGTGNIIANNIFNGTDSLLRVVGSNNVIENNTLHKVSDSLSAVVYQGVIVISSDSNDNTVRYNDLYYYDGYRRSYTTGDDSVTVLDGATGNIVQDNYGNISEVVIPTPEETNYTYITYNVTSMAELISALDDIKANGTYSEDTKYVINLLEGDYTITEAITWGGGTSDVRDVIINGNGQVIDGKGSSSTFLTIAAGYSLTFYNLTVSNFTLAFMMMTFMVSGDLNIYDCILDSPGMIIAMQGTSVNINNTKINDIVLYGVSANITVTNSTIFNTNTSSMTRIGIITNTGKTVFINNNVSNITGQYIITSIDNTATAYIENNVFSDNNCSEEEIHLSFGEGSQVQGTIMNNTFINGVKIDLKITDPTNVFIIDNNYINCSLPVNITGIEDTNITTEDYTTTITVSPGSSYGANVDGKITILINGEEYKTYDVVNGKANITIENSALNVLTNNIEIKYTSEDGSYENTTATFTITLTEDVIIRIPEGTLYSGDTIPLTTQVSVNGTIVTDGYVIFKVNGKTVKDENGNTIMAYVDENGIASINYTIPDTYSNEYNISIVYSGSSGIVRSNTTLTTSLKTATITVDKITAKAGQTVTLRAYITDQNGNPVSSGKLVFKLNGKTLKDANGNTLYATIVNGVATLNYTIPENYSAKDYILTAVYQGTGFERSEANSTLTLTKSTPTIIPDSTVFGTNNTITITQGTESVNIKATIIDPETNAPIDTTTVVTIKINDKTVTQQYVSNGQIDMTIYTSSFKNPEYNITVVVGENSQYARTSFNGTLIVNPMNTLANETSYNGTLLVKED